MSDDSRVIDKGWDALPDYGKSGDADEAVTVSMSTTPGEWLVNTVDSVVVPMSMAEVVEALQRHQLNERSLVWRAGMQEWAPVDRVPQLKLAARLPFGGAARQTPSAAADSAPAPAAAAPRNEAAQQTRSRRSTLPFGLPTPPAASARSGSRPSNPRPSSAPHAAAAPLVDEPEVLAVYDRPVATTSFDLSPEQPLRKSAAGSVPPQTLAPTTTDSSPRRAPRSADLSVVAASEFRSVQRHSKRLVWISSLASAAAASVLTFWLAHGTTARSSADTNLPLTAPAPPSAAPSAPSHPPENPLPSASSSAAAADISSAAPPEPPPAKPKAPPRKPRGPSLAAQRRARALAAASDGSPQPSAEPNPYDSTPDDPAVAKPTPPTTAPPSSEPEHKLDAPSPPADTSPGF